MREAKSTRTMALPSKEDPMGRKHIDCRELPSDINCTVAISADSERELLDAAVQHGVKMHGHSDTPEFREMLRKILRDGEVKR